MSIKNMVSEKYTKKMYDLYGKEYQRARDERKSERLYNELLELPCIIKAVGNIKRKRLLDIGCGAGIHIKKYLKEGAKVEGIDISNTMIELARKKCPKVEFKIGTITKLPYKNSEFDIITASLIINYVDNLKKAFKEVNRVLKKGGLFYFSDNSIIKSAIESIKNKKFKYKFVGYIENRKTGKLIVLGDAWKEEIFEDEFVPGMITKHYLRTFRTFLNELTKSGFELIDFIDCKPVPAFKKYDAAAYKIFTKVPMFSIYVARKK